MPTLTQHPNSDNSKDSFNQKLDHITAFHLLNYLRGISFGSQRNRTRKSYFKILYAIYLSTKSMKNQGNILVFPKLKTLCEMSGYGRSTVSAFINSETFKEFCDMRRSSDPDDHGSNEYFLKREIFQVFHWLEKFGMMRRIHQEPKKWNERFEKRARKWLIPSLESGETFERLYNKKRIRKSASKATNSKEVMNNLSTKIYIKLDPYQPLKLDPIKTSYPSHKALRDIRTKSVHPPPFFKEFDIVYGVLQDRFQMSEGDIHKFMKNNSLSDLKYATNTLEKWMKGGWMPTSTVRALQSQLNKKSKRKR